mmetsp:Transcript_127681/g.357504  ORF Transcript_127681/g.357504 Transcript_127681/m.357504 type:complete len:295 (-) Transcript_127681:377-1261(-)
MITAEAMEIVARELLRRPNGHKVQLSVKSEKDQWSCFFGTTPIVAANIWNRIDPVTSVDRFVKPKHLLYAFVLVKQYSGDKAHGMIVGCHPNTFSKWAWKMVEAIHDLHPQVIRMANRFDGWDRNVSNAALTIDCSDNACLESWPFDTTMWSHKINGPAWKYEVGLSIYTGNICHWDGPHKPSVADITIFRGNLMQKLDAGECVESDSGCAGESCLKTPSIAKSRTGRSQKSAARAQQENIFMKVKKFGAFSTPFVHTKEKHKLAYGAVLVMLQLGLELGTVRNWRVEYATEYF